MARGRLAAYQTMPSAPSEYSMYVCVFHSPMKASLALGVQPSQHVAVARTVTLSPDDHSELRIFRLKNQGK